MHAPTVPLFTALMTLVASLWPTPAADDFEKLAPWTDIKITETRIEVFLQDDWFVLQSIEGVSAEDLLAVARRDHGRRWDKRIAEDLVEVLAGAGVDVGSSVELELVPIDGGDVLHLESVPMTEDNRRAVRNSRRQPRDRPRESVPTTLTRTAALEDLHALRSLIDERHSYRHLRDVDLDALVEDAASRLDETVRRDAFALEVDRIIHHLGDGHAGVRDPGRRSTYTPFLLGDSSQGVVAFQPDRSGFLDEAHPFLLSIDGLPLDEWLAAAGVWVTDGSPALKRERSLRRLREIGFLREQMGAATDASIEVTLGADPQGDGSTTVLRLAVTDRKPLYGVWPPTPREWLWEGLGYVRLPDMTDEDQLLAGLLHQVRTHRDSRGLIVDVRGNGGGTRDALRLLWPELLPVGSPPTVVNVATPRVVVDKATGHAEPEDDGLDTRLLFPRDAEHWSDEELEVVEAFAESFRPDWDPGSGFGDWYYTVLSGRPAGPSSPTADDRPVVILMDSACFSATDIFLGALARRPGVTLVGTPSGGGSGRSREYTLANSRVVVRLSSMASFQPDGQPYDSRGVAPDIEVRPAPGDYLGRGDAQLEKAVEVLRGG